MIEKPKKIFCEICGNKNKVVLHIHHIIPRRDPRCTNKPTNLACLCSNCHNQVHAGIIIIIGIYLTTAGRKIFWFEKGEEPPLPKEMWRVKDNPLVETLHIKKDI